MEIANVIIQTITLLITVVNLVGVTYLGIWLTAKNHTTDTFNKIHELKREREEVKKMYSQLDSAGLQYTKNELDVKMAELQLQTKHLMMEADNSSFVSLTSSQYRLLADLCKEFLYYDQAKVYWEKCFSLTLPNREIESEYRRAYAQFLYGISEKNEGNQQYENATKLSNDNDGCKYINVTTYVSWINDIMNSERDLYYNKELDSEVIKVNSSQIEGLLQNAKNIASSIHDIGMKKQCNDDIDKANYRYLLSRGQIDVHNENKAPND